MATQLQLVKLTNDVPRIDRHKFPNDFVFGTAGSAYQYEGAATKRGKNIWDTFCHKYPWKIKDKSNGDVAVDHHNRFKEDVRIMKEMGVDAYRFSISWSRILPTGKLRGGVNEDGVNFYKELIKELTDSGIEPYVTLFHFDLPQHLEREYGGFLSPKIVNDFRDFADVCFSRFGNKVKHWITLNEPWSYCFCGYVTGSFAPGYRSAPRHNLVGGFSMDRGCTWRHLRFNEWDSLTPEWDSTLELPDLTWDSVQDDHDTLLLGAKGTKSDSRRKRSGDKPYWAAHYLLLAHAAAVKKYRESYQVRPGEKIGKIGITLVTMWFEPYSELKSDRDAAMRALAFYFGWFMDPLTTGDYPQSMKANVGSRLPKFSAEESKMVKGSFDFLGLNYYTANYAANVTNYCDNGKPNYITDSRVDLQSERNGIPIGPQAASEWLFVYPQGIWKLLLHIKQFYNNPLIYITENGYDDVNDPNIPLWKACCDHNRIDYHYRHLFYVQRAINDHDINVKGYFAWSLLDNFEWGSGYTVRFGIHLVDYKDNLKRYMKLSALWFKELLQNRGK